MHGTDFQKLTLKLALGAIMLKFDFADQEYVNGS
jgi:hypothetical protein